MIFQNVFHWLKNLHCICITVMAIFENILPIHTFHQRCANVSDIQLVKYTGFHVWCKLNKTMIMKCQCHSHNSAGLITYSR